MAELLGYDTVAGIYDDVPCLADNTAAEATPYGEFHNCM